MMKGNVWSRIFRLCAAALLLCGALTVGALAAGPGDLEVQLTYTGGGPGISGANVTSGYAALLEDGAQVAVGGQLLSPIAGGSVVFNYPFVPGKTYEVAVQEGMTAPYYEAKTIPISPADISTAISTGVTVTDTVTWVEWSKPIKVSLEDSTGLPLAMAGIDITLVATDADPINPTYQTVEVTKATDSSGTATFYDFSYDPLDSNMCNVYDNRFFIIAHRGDTTIVQFYDLATAGGNQVALCWPTATVSGVVWDAGTPKAGQRVCAYYDLMTPCTYDSIGNYWSWDGDPLMQEDSGIPPMKDYDDATGASTLLHVLQFPLKGRVYYTATNSAGSYTLALPEGVPATLCVDDAGYTPANQYQRPTLFGGKNAVNYDYVDKAFPHFPWLRTLKAAGGNLVPYTNFMGLRCLELAPVTCTPFGAMAGYDLAMSQQYYTMIGTVKAAGHSYSGQITMSFTSGTPPLSAGLHSGGIAETAMTWDISNGTINKTDVKLIPGDYTVSIINDDPEHCDGYTPLTVTITAAEVASGVVNLGTLDFAPIPKAPVVSKPGKPGIDIGAPLPDPPSGDGFGYLRTRLEKVEDLAYSGASYEITLHYTAFHTNAAVNQVENAQLAVELPAGISVNDPGGMTVTGTPATGVTLTKTFLSIPTGETNSITFSVRVEPTAAQNYFAVLCKAAPNFGGSTLQTSSAVTLQRLKINLSAPRLLSPSTPFRVFGDITGAGEAGVNLNRISGGVSALAATGAKKGRYYYFDVSGQNPGIYQFQAETARDGVSETSAPATVQVGSGLPKVEDVYIVDAGGKTISKNATFNMVYYTAFVSSGDLAGPSFDVYVKVNGVLPTSTLNVEVMGLSYPAAFDAGTGYWKATVNNYAAYGDYDLMLSIDGTYTTQIGRLLLLF